MSKYKINKGFITQKQEDSIVIFDGDSSILYTLNSTASYIFNKLKLGWNEIKIAQYLTKKYLIDEKVAKNDVNKLLTDLRRKKIIHF